jgi:hypothetical protein
MAFFPMDKHGGCGSSGVSLHGAFAVIFFSSIFYICIFMSETTLKQIQDAGKQAWFRNAYRWCSGIMIGSVALAVASRLLPGDLVQALCERGAVFWFEAVGVWAFSAFWYIKTRELDPSVSWVPFRRKRAS